jgi:hypothetical protein
MSMVIACGRVLVAFDVQVHNSNVRVSSHLLGNFVDDVVSEKSAPSDDKDWSGNHFRIHAAGKEENEKFKVYVEDEFLELQEGICM